MGSITNPLVILIMFYAILRPHDDAQASSDNSNYTNQDSLNSFLHDYAIKNRLHRPRTGQLYNVSLPLNFSGMEVSIIRLRTHSLWKNGVNLSSFDIPHRTLPMPFTRRFDIVYQNLGNWSASYHNVPDHTFVTPVIGFLAYDSNGNRSGVELSGDRPIIVRFQNISEVNGRMRCVRFLPNGTVELSNVTARQSCLARGTGHFSVVVPYRGPEKRGGGKDYKWWIVGVVVGFVGLFLIVVGGCFAYRVLGWRRMRNLERESERSEGLETVWIGGSRMPAASGIRTQPVLENNYAP